MDMDDHSMEMGFLPASGLQLYTSSILVNELKKPKNMSFEHKPHPYTIAQNKNSKMTRPVQVATWSLRKATWSFTAGKGLDYPSRDQSLSSTNDNHTMHTCMTKGERPRGYAASIETTIQGRGTLEHLGCRKSRARWALNVARGRVLALHRPTSEDTKRNPDCIGRWPTLAWLALKWYYRHLSKVLTPFSLIFSNP